MDEAQESSNVQLELSFNCPNNVCKYCDAGFDPASDCTTCLPGYYGPKCTKCPNCNHGKCQDGKEGSGKCVCDEGWGPSETCNQCLEGFWGIECSKCPNCNGHGKCNEGLHGDGKCKCDGKCDCNGECECGGKCECKNQAERQYDASTSVKQLIDELFDGDISDFCDKLFR